MAPTGRLEGSYHHRTLSTPPTRHRRSGRAALDPQPSRHGAAGIPALARPVPAVPDVYPTGLPRPGAHAPGNSHDDYYLKATWPMDPLHAT